MARLVIPIVLPSVVALAAAGLLVLWLGAGAGVALEQRLPAPRPAAALEPPVEIEGFFAAGEGRAADLPGAWPRFRGPNFDAVSDEDVRLARSWPAGGPPVLWSVALGEGYAGAAVAGGRVYVLDYDQQAGADTLRCLSLADGKEIWRRGYKVRVKRNHGMSRTIPAVTEKFVVTIGPRCHVMCADAKTGEFRWGLDLVREYQAREPPWYTGQCPLIDRGRAILAPGGSALLIAVDCQTGKVVWETPNPSAWRMTHSSIVPMDVAGRRTYVYCASGGVVGVSAETGEILWQSDQWRVGTANVPSPVILPGGRIFFTGSYNAGSAMMRIVQRGAKMQAERVLHLPADVFSSEQHTPVYYDGYLYGVDEDGRATCLEPTGNVVWRSGRADRFGAKGRGPYLIADGVIVVMDEDGTLSLVEATPSGFRRLARAKVLEGDESWGPMALAGGRLLARDLTRMVCLDLRAPRRRSLERPPDDAF